MTDIPLIVRASFCRGCGQFHGIPSAEEFAKLKRIEFEAGDPIWFLCESCNAIFVREYKAKHGVAPTPEHILGDPPLTLH